VTKRRAGSAAKRRQKHARATAAVPRDPLHPLYLPAGPFSEFPGLSHKHYIAREQAPANDAPEVLNPVDAYVLGGN
jgi:hypothetical protein